MTYHTAPPGAERGPVRRSPSRRLRFDERGFSATASSLVPPQNNVGSSRAYQLTRFAERELTARGVDANDVALAELSLEHAHRERVQHLALDGALERSEEHTSELQS